VYSVEMLTTNLMDILNRLESRNSIEDILILIAVEALLWSIFSLFLTLFLPKRYNPISLRYLSLVIILDFYLLDLS